MYKKVIVGQCCICGEKKELTFEHLPPKSIGNKKAVIESSVLLNKEKDIIKQRGSGIYSLCKKCNNDTGAMYITEYQKFHKNIVESGNIDTQNKKYINQFSFKPLKVFKQIVCMFLSINPPPIFLEKRENFKNFILNKEEQFLKDVKIYMYIQDSKSTVNRRNPLTSLMDTFYKNKILISEFVSGGIGYILTLDNINTCSVDSFYGCKGIYDITFFKNYTIEEEVSINIETSILETNSPFSLDFRKQFAIKETKFKVVGKESLDIKICDDCPPFIVYGLDSKYDSKIIFSKI